jgi:hypothetical protein
VPGNTGTFMRDVASSWIVTDLSGGAGRDGNGPSRGIVAHFPPRHPGRRHSRPGEAPIVQHVLALRSDRKAVTDESTLSAAREGTP